jgi:hypothetical protein
VRRRFAGGEESIRPFSVHLIRLNPQAGDHLVAISRHHKDLVSIEVSIALPTS